MAKGKVVQTLRMNLRVLTCADPCIDAWAAAVTRALQALASPDAALSVSLSKVQPVVGYPQQSFFSVFVTAPAAWVAEVLASPALGTGYLTVSMPLAGVGTYVGILTPPAASSLVRVSANMAGYATGDIMLVLQRSLVGAPGIPAAAKAMWVGSALPDAITARVAPDGSPLPDLPLPVRTPASMLLRSDFVALLAGVDSLISRPSKLTTLNVPLYEGDLPVPAAGEDMPAPAQTLSLQLRPFPRAVPSFTPLPPPPASAAAPGPPAPVPAAASGTASGTGKRRADEVAPVPVLPAGAAGPAATRQAVAGPSGLPAAVPRAASPVSDPAVLGPVSGLLPAAPAPRGGSGRGGPSQRTAPAGRGFGTAPAPTPAAAAAAWAPPAPAGAAAGSGESRLAASASTDPGHVTSADSASLERRQVAMHDASADATLEFAQSVRYSFSCRLFVRLLLHAARVLGHPGAPASTYSTGPDGQPLGDFPPGHRFVFCYELFEAADHRAGVLAKDFLSGSDGRRFSMSLRTVLLSLDGGWGDEWLTKIFQRALRAASARPYSGDDLGRRARPLLRAIMTGCLAAPDAAPSTEARAMADLLTGPDIDPADLLSVMECPSLLFHRMHHLLQDSRLALEPPLTDARRLTLERALASSAAPLLPPALPAPAPAAAEPVDNMSEDDLPASGAGSRRMSADGDGAAAPALPAALVGAPPPSH